MSEQAVRIAVVGAGVSGLSVVYCLMRELPASGIKYKITIFADQILDHTLSSGAGGIFRPDPHIGLDQETNDKWARLSFDHFSRIARSPDAKDAGIYFITGLHVSSRSEFSLNHLRNFCPDLRPLTHHQISAFLPNKFKHGYQYTTIISDPMFYLKWLLAQALTECDLVIRKITTLASDDALNRYDVIVNCSGLSARVIANDQQLISVRGQTIRVKAPWLKNFTWADGAYVYPMADGTVTLGGIKQFGSENRLTDQDDRDWIWSRCTEMQPSLKGCEVIQDWVGLRPFRQPIRVESEILPNGRQIVHNYGHGGNGFTYSYGTAMHATGLVISLLQAKQSSKL